MAAGEFIQCSALWVMKYANRLSNENYIKLSQNELKTVLFWQYL